MNVDKFGHHLHKRIINTKQLENTFDLQHKTLKHIGEPIDPADCATKQYVDKLLCELTKKIKAVEQLLSQLNNDVNKVDRKLDDIARKQKRK